MCNQELIIGGSNDAILTISMTIIPTCLSCMNLNNRPFIRPRFNIGSSLVTLNADVYQLQHQLFVTNFSSLSPPLLDGQKSRIICAQYPLFTDVFPTSKN